MKKILIVLMGFAVLILLGSDVRAASDEGDELQRQYLVKLMKIDLGLEIAHIQLRGNFEQSKSHQKSELLELQYRGRIPHDVEMRGQELKDEEARTEENIKDLEREKENLKLDALKFYNGKMPKWLSKKWQKEETDYSKNIDENFTKKLQEEMGK